MTADVPSYKSPPVIQSVVEFRFADAVDAAEMERISGSFATSYLSATTAEEVQFKLDAEHKQATVEGTEKFISRTSEDTLEQVIIKSNSLATCQLAPYCGWGSFSERVVRDYERVRGRGYRKLSRLGMRYINRVDLPANGRGGVEHEEYLNLRVAMPLGYEDSAGYNINVNVALPHPTLKCVINSATVPPEIVGTGAFLLDIDIFAESDLPAKIEDTMELLSAMREHKNRLFEASITDKARALFR